MLCEAVVAEDRYGDYLVEAFSTAEARLSERQVLRYTEDDGVVELGSFGIEAAYAGSADACVDAGEDVEYDTLTTQISLRFVFVAPKLGAVVPTAGISPERCTVRSFLKVTVAITCCIVFVSLPER